MKKKALSLALALAMCLSLTVPAFAAEPFVWDDQEVCRITNVTYVQEDWDGLGAGQPLTCNAPVEVTLLRQVDVTVERRVWDESGEECERFPVAEIPDGEYSAGFSFQLKEPGEYAIGFGWEIGGDFANTGYTIEVVAENKPTDPEPTTPPAETIPASGTAKASTQTVTVDGKSVEFQMYALVDENGNGTNYIKLRDMAYVLNGTKAQFSVGYDNATKSISVASGAYEASGAEMTTPYSGDRTYTGGTQTIQVNGEAVDMTAITLLDDAGGGYNYFKLRDLGKALGFNVGWSKDAGVFIESDKPYAE